MPTSEINARTAHSRWLLVRGLIVGALLGVPVTWFFAAVLDEVGVFSRTVLERHGDPLSVTLIGIAIGSMFGLCGGIVEDARPGITAATLRFGLRGAQKLVARLMVACDESRLAENRQAIEVAAARTIVQIGLEILLLTAAVWLWYPSRRFGLPNPILVMIYRQLGIVVGFAALGGLIGLITGQMLRGVVLATVVCIGTMLLLFVLPVF